MATGSTNAGSGGRVMLDELIAQYRVAAGEEVDAGRFVEFVEEYIYEYVEDFGRVSDTKLNESGFVGDAVRATLMSDNRVFVAYGVNGYFYGVVLTIDGITITKGIETQLGSDSSSWGRDSHTIVLPNDRLFVTHASYVSLPPTYDCLAGSLISVTGTNLKKIASKTIGSTTTTTMAGHSIALLPDGRIFVAYMENSGGAAVYFLLVSLTEDKISISSNYPYRDYTPNSCTSSVVLHDGRILTLFVAKPNGSYIYGTLVTVNGTGIESATSIRLSFSGQINGYNDYAMLLPDGKVFVAYTYSLGFYGVVLTIEGDTIVKGVETQLGSTAYEVQVMALPNNKAYISYCPFDWSAQSVRYLSGMIVSIKNDIITIEADTLLSEDESSGISNQAVLLPDGKIFIAHTLKDDVGYTHLYGMLAAGGMILPVPITAVKHAAGAIDGVSRTSGKAGDIVDVYVIPDTTT